MTAASSFARAATAKHPRHLCLKFAATQDGVRSALGDLRGFMQAARIGADACGTAEIVMAEALNNVAEHAYRMSGAGDIELTVRLTQSAVSACITDAGAPLPGLCLPEAEAPLDGSPQDNLPEGGFGWFLIHSLTSALTYRRVDGTNHLAIEMDLLPASEAR